MVLGGIVHILIGAISIVVAIIIKVDDTDAIPN